MTCQRRYDQWGLVLLWIGLGLMVPTASAEQIRYRYDDMNRLTVADPGNGMLLKYAYDPMGNRTSAIVNAAPNGCAPRQLCNGNFDLGWEFWTLEDPMVRVTPDGREGQGLELEGRGQACQRIFGLLGRGQTYQVTAWCYAAAGDVCTLRLSNTGNKGSPQGDGHTVTHTITGNGRWQRLQGVLTLVQTEEMLVCVETETPHTPVRVDEVMLKEITGSVYLLWSR